MRDPKRIEPFMKTITDVWKKYPDLRFGQLILNVFPDNIDFYYVEDDKFFENIKEYSKNAKGGNTIGNN
jgi:hypothetical protein